MAGKQSQQDDMPAERLLDLDTLIRRDRVAIDGEMFEILHPDELSVIDSHRFGRWGKRIEQLAEMDGEAEEQELDELIARLARRILVGVPDEVFDRLPGSQRWAVIDLFTGLLLRTKLRVAGAMQAAMGPMPDLMGRNPLIGARRSPGFSGSTADPRQHGLWTRLRRWCARIFA